MRAVRLFAAALVALPATLPGQEPLPDSLLSVARYLDYERVSDPRISPDGSRIVFTRRWINRLEDRWDAALWIMNADGSQQRFLATGANAVWSPDGQRVAYLAEGEPKGTQVFVRWVDLDGPATQVTRLTEAPANLRWLPDGRHLGFTQFVASPESWAVAMPKPPEGAKWTKAPRYVERLHYRQDRRGFTERGNTHLFVVPAEGGSPRQVTSGDWSVGFRFDGLAQGVAWDVTPDGRTVIVEGYDEADADLNYRDAHLYAVDLATGTRRRLTSEPGTWRQPVLSPDGTLLAFTGAPKSDATYRAEELFVMNVDGTGRRTLSAGLDRDPGEVTWAADGSALYFTANDRGANNVHVASLRGGVRPLTTGAHMLSLGGVSRAGVAVAVRTSPQQPEDVVRFDVRKPAPFTQLTHVNDDLLQGVRLGAVEEVWYTSSGGARVQGWIVTPPDFDRTKKYPLLMEIHGGPHAMYNVAFNYMFQNFAANGYVVLYTNPRGSTGYGSAFGNAIYKAYPSVDYDDLMAGVDLVVGRGSIDTDRMYVGGCSGGGVLSSWVTSRTARFAAAAVRCPVTNWISMFGQTDIPLFTNQWFRKPFWEDPQPWLDQSPLMQVGKVQTPTLLMTGELDLRTPMPQTEEYYAALKFRGVPSALLRFEGEYHGTGSRPSNFMRTQLYMMGWYQRFSGTGKAAAAR